MFLIMGAILTIGCLSVTISLYNAIKRGGPLVNWIAKLIEINPLFSFAFNFAISFLLTTFIGAGMISGAANLVASIIFAVYVMIISKKDRMKNNKNKVYNAPIVNKAAEKDSNKVKYSKKKVKVNKNYNIKQKHSQNRKGKYESITVEKVGEKIGKSLKRVKKVASQSKILLNSTARVKVKEKLQRFVKGIKKGLK